eukprot:12401-Heterococcus_DN1.PRE.2
MLAAALRQQQRARAHPRDVDSEQHSRVECSKVGFPAIFQKGLAMWQQQYIVMQQQLAIEQFLMQQLAAMQQQPIAPLPTAQQWRQ